MKSIFAKGPIFLLRWANAVMMRILPAYLMLMFLYMGISEFLLQAPMPDNAKLPESLFFLVFVFAVFWGFVYTALRPSVAKSAYLLSYTRCRYHRALTTSLRSKLNKMIAGRVFLIFIYVIAISGAEVLFLRFLLLINIVELVLNSLILLRLPKMGSFEVLDRLYLKQVTPGASAKPPKHRQSCTVRTTPVAPAPAPTAAKPTVQPKPQQKAQPAKSGGGTDARLAADKKTDEIFTNLKQHGYRLVIKAPNGKGIRLKNGDVSHKFHRILTGANGVFVIDSYYYSGVITVDKEGNWSHASKGGSKRESQNPIPEMCEKAKFLQAMLGNDVPVIPVICMTYPDCELNVSREAPCRFVPQSSLKSFLTKYRSNTTLEKQRLGEIADCILAHKTEEA